MALPDDFIKRAEERRGFNPPVGFRQSPASVTEWARRIRRPNSIPKGVSLTVIFKEETFTEVVEYEYHGKKNPRDGAVIKALLQRNDKASQLVMGRTYPLILPISAYRGLENQLAKTGEDIEAANLNERKFTVRTNNHKTYHWEENL